MPPLTVVVALVWERAAQTRISEAVRGFARVEYCGRVGELRSAVERVYRAGCRVGAVIVDVRDREGTPSAGAIASLRQQLPAVPVLAYCSPAPTSSADLLAAARAGVSGVLLRGHDDVGVALRSALESAGDDCAARHIMAELDFALPRSARPVVEHCVLHGREPLTVACVARALGVHRKTLVNRLSASGLPEPRCVIAWCRLCLAAHALEDPGVTIERVAMDFQFPSATAFRNLCKRYTGLRATEVRQNGGLRCVLHLFARALRGGVSDESSLAV